MDRGIYPIVAGAVAQERRLDMVTGNLANVQTAAYKREKAIFKTLLANTVAGGDKKSADKLYPQMTTTFIDWKEGTLRPTGNQLDMALNGEGFFELQTPGGSQYTRNGNFTLNEQRQLATRDGALVMGQGGPLQIPVGKITVDERGEIKVNDTTVGTVKIVKFDDLATAVKNGDRFSTGGETSPAPRTQVVHESLEESNVNAVEEFTTLMEINRQYEAAQKVVQVMDDVARQAASEIGRPA